jgi:hypothetical protein
MAVSDENCRRINMNFRNSIMVSLLISIVLIPVPSLFSQSYGDIPLMEPVVLKKLGIEFCPPAFWNPMEGQNLNFVAYTGPGESGIFPGIKIMFRDGEEDLIQSKAALSAAVRVSLLGVRMENITLVDELSTSLGGRSVLEQLFSCVQGTRKVTAVADHFNACGKQYTFLYFHGSSVFDKHLPLAREVFNTIFVPGEEQGVEGWLLFYGTLTVCVVWGSYTAYQMMQSKALKQASVARLEVIRREEEQAAGPGGLDFDEWQDDGLDIQDGKFNIVEIKMDGQKELDE